MTDHNNPDVFEKPPWKRDVRTRKAPPKQPSEKQKHQHRVKRRIEALLEQRALEQSWRLEIDHDHT